MRVAVVYSDYRSDLPSGEREVVKNECAALARAGVDVHLVSAATDEGLRDPLYPLRAAGRVATGFGASPLERILDIAPDLVHVHNLFPNFGTRWLRRFEETRTPLVTTLHNYRLLCAQGSLFRDGSPCTRCPDGAGFSAVRYGCYRGSRLASLPLALANIGRIESHPLVAASRRIIVLSGRQRDILTKFGLPEEGLVVEPSFLPDNPRRSSLDNDPRRRNGWVFAGRVDDQKGVEALVDSWPTGENLTIIGDGPRMDDLRARAREGVEFVGRRPVAEVAARIGAAEGFIFPSRAFETQGIVYLESLSVGTPVVALAGNTVADAVRSEATGVVIERLEEIAAALASIRSDWSNLSSRCIEVGKLRYSPGPWVQRRLALYEEVLA